MGEEKRKYREEEGEWRKNRKGRKNREVAEKN